MRCPHSTHYRADAATCSQCIGIVASRVRGGVAQGALPDDEPIADLTLVAEGAEAPNAKQSARARKRWNFKQRPKAN